MSGLLEVGSRIGRYFGLVSALPSAILVLFIFMLASSGAWHGPPNWNHAGAAVAGVSLGTIAALSGAALLLGLVLHPLQSLIVQLYEGYWGVSAAARRIAFARAMRRQRYITALRKEQRELAYRLNLKPDPQSANWLNRAWLEAGRLETAFPKDALDFMPTRLGNALKRYERDAGAPYGLDAIRVVPHLALVAPDKDVAYLDDQRHALDLAVRMSVTSLLAACCAFAFLWRDGLWLLVALVPYGLAYLFYRGSVVTAREYGTAMAALVALNRFALYERLGVPKPADSQSERDLNQFGTRQLLESQPEADVAYTEPRRSRWRTLVDWFR